MNEIWGKKKNQGNENKKETIDDAMNMKKWSPAPAPRYACLQSTLLSLFCMWVLRAYIGAPPLYTSVQLEPLRITPAFPKCLSAQTVVLEWLATEPLIFHILIPFTAIPTIHPAEERESEREEEEVEMWSLDVVVSLQKMYCYAMKEKRV